MTPGILKVHMPFTTRKRGGRKLIVSPEGVQWSGRSSVSNALAKALGRAFRWRRLLENSEYVTIDEIAKAEGVNPSYVSRVLRLTLLSPAYVEAILDGHEQPHLQDLLNPFSASWAEQERPNVRTPDQSNGKPVTAAVI